MKKILKTILIPIVLLAWNIPAYAASTADATLELKSSAASVSAGQQFTVDVVVKNPGLKKIISVRSWLSYNNKEVKALSIDTKDSEFTLSAPGEDTVSDSEGLVKIGRSNIAGGMVKTETTAAKVTFQALAPYALQSKISFYDYQISELGHTSVNVIESGFPLNILSTQPTDIIISLNPGGSAAPAAGTALTPAKTAPVTALPPAPSILPAAIPPAVVALLAPANLKVNTGSGYADLKWTGGADKARAGFNIYYGGVSGTYSRRRSTGNLTSYRLTGLNNNETYYFAVTAYDKSNNESDYSNEAGIIINQPLSSTHPVSSVLQKSLKKIPSQPQNGPLIGWLVFSAAGLGGAAVFGRRRKLTAWIHD